MKNIKFTANELLDSFNREYNQEEMNEIYKALIAYELSYNEIDEKLDVALTDLIENVYFDRDDIKSFVNPDLLNEADKTIYNEEVVEWERNESND